MQKVIITGGNKGIGKAIAQKMTALDYQVVIVSRNQNAGNQAVEDIKQKTGKQSINCIQADLSTIKGCQDLVSQIKENHSDISCLINNAGLWQTDKVINEDGLEMSFMVNYLAPFILSTELKETLIKNSPARIINVNAGLYVKGKIDTTKTPIGEDFHAFGTYANTKLANVMFTLDFAQELENSKEVNQLTINAVHPGVIQTDLGNSDKLLSKIVQFVKRFWKSPEYGAEAPVWLANDATLTTTNGKYFNEKKEIPYSQLALDKNLRQELYKKTMDILGNKN